MLGSHWKRLAQAHQARGNFADVEAELVKMQTAYWRAADLARQRNGEPDHYPLFNALDADFLIAARGDSKKFNKRITQLSALLRAGTENAKRQYAENRKFFHALAEVEALRIDALWACYDGRDEACITQPSILIGLIDRYCDVFERLGSGSEQDSATNQLHFLMDMLTSGDKSKKVREELKKLAEGIRKCVGG